MRQASKHLRVSYNTFKKYAVQYDLFEPNQCGRGIKKPKNITINRSDDSLFWDSEEEVGRLRDNLLKSLS